MRKLPLWMPLVVAAIVCSATEGRSDALARLQADKLAAVHQAVMALRADWQAVLRVGPYREHRANLHVHSHWSHDSRGTLDEIVAAARTTGTSVLMFTEHPADHYDFFKQGHQGVKDGVLLIPGAEMQGFLTYPTMSVRGLNPGTPQELSDLVTGRGGLMFVSHLEERMDWKIRDVTGVEIYNTHADFKDEKKMIGALKNPLWMFQASTLIRQYPQEAYSALQDYPADYLKKWTELCETAPHTGVSANDAHQNIGLLVRWVEGDKARLEDSLGKTLLELNLALIPDSDELRKGKQAGDILFRLQLDPYENALRHVATHLLLAEFSEKGVREALTAGRAFVAFDWLGDATGFDFAAVNDLQRHEMGSQPPWSRDLTLRAKAPLPAHWRLLRGAEVIAESTGRTFEFTPAGPGNYRIEAWLDIAGERMIWIISNPIYLSAPPK